MCTLQAIQIIDLIFRHSSRAIYIIFRVGAGVVEYSLFIVTASNSSLVMLKEFLHIAISFYTASETINIFHTDIAGFSGYWRMHNGLQESFRSGKFPDFRANAQVSSVSAPPTGNGIAAL